MNEIDKEAGPFETETRNKTKSPHKPLKAGLVIIASGLLISVFTGLPIKLFMIFNSMKPNSITMQVREFDSSDASKISISTAHSVIRLVEGSSDKIRLEYEKSDWLDFDTACTDGELVFKETSNGRLPLFSLVSIHENRAELTVTLPAGYHPDEVDLESRGGFIFIESVDYPVDAKTYTGSIYLDTAAPSGTTGTPASISARTSSGIIKAGGINAGVKADDDTTYEVLSEGGVDIRLSTDRGDIIIEK